MFFFSVPSAGGFPACSVDVHTGEVRVGAAGDVLVSNGIGSCIAAVAVDPRHAIGGIAHVMLPGTAPPHSVYPLRYARNALRELHAGVLEQGGDPDSVSVFLAGAGNVVRNPADTLCRDNIRSVITELFELGCRLGHCSLGGTDRRRVRCICATGEVFCAVGSGAELLMGGCVPALSREERTFAAMHLKPDSGGSYGNND